MVGLCALAGFAQSASAGTARVVEPQGGASGGGDVAADQKNAKSKEEDFADKVLKKIPYGQSLKQVWHVVDGDVDLYFEDLRMDRGNRGVSYKMDFVPLIDRVDGTGLKAHVGEDSKLTFESDYVPLVGRVDGLQFKASTGNNGSHMLLRYKTSIAW